MFILLREVRLRFDKFVETCLVIDRISHALHTEFQVINTCCNGKPQVVHILPADAILFATDTKFLREEPKEGETTHNLLLTALMAEGKARWIALDLLIGSLSE